MGKGEADGDRLGEVLNSGPSALYQAFPLALSNCHPLFLHQFLLSILPFLPTLPRQTVKMIGRK